MMLDQLRIGGKISAVHDSVVGRFLDFFEPYHCLKRRPETDRIHLDETMGWLARAQDACNSQGVSISYAKLGGWHPDPYPETSGYIIATFLKYVDFSGNMDFFNRAVALGRWEINIQRSDGAVLSSVRDDIVRVFNTGQVVLGWCYLFEKTGDQRYLDAAKKSGYYLVGIQEQDGAWIRDTHCGARTYHARVAWSLLRLAELTGEQVFVETGIRNLRWILAQQNENGWFRNCGFYSDPPITHVIGYTIRGLLECQQLTAKHGWDVHSSKVLGAVICACRQIMDTSQKYSIRDIPGLLPAAFNEKWQPSADYSCLTGNAQLAICLMRVGQITGEDEYFATASLLIDALKRVQNVNSSIPGIRGGVAGSFPLYQTYLRGKYPNWAAKFMADALMMRIQYPNWWIQA